MERSQQPRMLVYTQPMQRNFCKAALISLATYSGGVAIGFLVDFRLTLFAVPALLLSWSLFCFIRLVQLRIAGGHKAGAEPYNRESYGFALGGSISSLVLLAAIVVLSQAD